MPLLATPPMKLGTINFEESDLVKAFAPIGSGHQRGVDCQPQHRFDGSHESPP
jgi:hypothetical protein